MKKILIPTDFYKVTENALKVATEVARKTHAEVELLHIIEAPYDGEFTTTGEYIPHDGMDNVFIIKSIEVARSKMKKIMDDVRYVGVRFIPKIKIGNPYTHFSKHVTKEPADLIIMGTEGTQGFLKGIFSCSNTEKVITNANCMVLSVKAGVDKFKIRNVLFASNFKDDSPEFVEKLKELQNIFDFKIHFVYVDAILHPKNNIERIKNRGVEFIKENQIRNYEFHIVEDLTEYTGITEFAKSIEADIIALSTHQHKGLHCLGGISDDLVNNADQPVLTYKAE